jgi:hypothetical protein
MNAEFQVLVEHLIELGEVVHVLGDIGEKVLFLTMFLRMTLRILFCWCVSRKMLSGRSSESTIPLTKLRYSE